MIHDTPSVQRSLKQDGRNVHTTPVYRKSDKPEPRRSFQEFCRCMRIKWNFKKEPIDGFSESPSFEVKSNWKHPLEYPNLGVFLCNTAQKLKFSIKDLFNKCDGVRRKHCCI